MKTKSVIIVVVILCVSILTIALAGVDVPLKSKIPSWKYVVIIQAGKHYGDKDWQIERNIIDVLRGDKNELPSFDQWMSPKFQKQDKYYLMCYYSPVEERVVPQWISYDLEKTNNTFIVKNCWAKETSMFDGRMADYYDTSLEKFKQLLNQIPYEPDKEKRKILKRQYEMTNPEP